jgi:uncharacterized membrane protein
MLQLNRQYSVTENLVPRSTSNLWDSKKFRASCWWLLLLVCILYGAFAFEMFRIELTTNIGSAEIGGSKERNARLAFLLHSLMGGIGLICGALQFNQNILKNNKLIHKTLGWTYLISIWGASVAGTWNSIYFDVPFSAKIIFQIIGVWWFISTTAAYLKIKNRKIQEHKNWMMRSFAISLFFVTFPLWVPGLQRILADDIAWPVGLLIAVCLNLMAAEWWISRKSREK